MYRVDAVDEETALLKKHNQNSGPLPNSSPSSSSFSRMSKVFTNPILTSLCGVVVGFLLFAHPSTKMSNHGAETVVVPAAASSSPPPPQTLAARTTSTNSKYTHFQALNFQIYTGGAPVYIGPNNATNPECHDLTIEGVAEGVERCYMGHEDGTQDALDRLAVMRQAVERAYQVSSKSSDTLKVFVAPEFFFRGRNGAYLLTDYNESAVFDDLNGVCVGPICRVLDGLEKLVADGRFKDWIFLFGTAIISETLPKEDAYDYLFYNFGMLYKGYDPATNTRHGKRFIVPKRYVSTSDFLTPNRNTGSAVETSQILQTALPQKMDSSMVLNPAENLYRNKYDSRIWRVYKKELVKLGYHMIEYGWLKMDGLTLSVEICLDHDLRAALYSYMADSCSSESTLIPSTNSTTDHVDFVPIPRHQAQLSLVSSAGMSVNEASVVLANGGSIILQDGLSEDPTTKAWVFGCFMYEWQFEGGSEVIRREATVTPTEVVFHYDVHQSYVKHSVYAENWQSQLRGVFTNAQYEPMITVYDTAPIALVATSS